MRLIKKALISLLTIFILVFSLVLIACDQGSTSVYDGNYQEITPQQLYADTKDLPELDEENLSNVKIYLKAETTQTSDTSITSNALTLSYTIGECDYSIYPETHIQMTYEASAKTDGKKEEYQSLITNIYIIEDRCYADISEKISTHGNETEYSTKKEINSYELEQLLNQFTGAFEPSQDVKEPQTEEEFISYVNELYSSHGVKILADTSNGIKVKMEIADEEKYANYIKEQENLYGYDIEMNDVVSYVVFDKDNNFKALKDFTDIRANSLKDSIRSITNLEIKAFSGKLNIPSDFSDYTPLS
ncbi:MAG: hypothetical protein E7353_02065 [Clostridiales bacterium]|nr:hypothetical protein [Clostridiales bacterium]